MRSALRFLAANYYIMFCGASSSNYCTKRQRFYPLPLFFALKRAENPFSFYRQQTADLPPIQRLAAGGGFTLDVSVHIGRLRRPGRAGVHRREQEGTGHQTWFPIPSRLPLPSFALTHRRCAAKRGLRGLGSVRRADFGTLSGPEVSWRDLPRITVRGQTVQSVRLVLRKAPLRSSVDPWSTKRHCGPLAFRRATEGSRVQRKMRGSQEGDKKPGGCLGPLLPLPPGGGNARLAHRQPFFACGGKPPERREIYI